MTSPVMNMWWCLLISTSLLLSVALISGQVEQTFRLQHFAKEYSVDSIVPVYQSSMKYVHGSITLLFNSACQWNGSYSIKLLNNDYFTKNRPYEDVISRLGSDLIYFDLSKLTCVNMQQLDSTITIKLKRRDTVNVDPYDLVVFGFALKDLSMTYENVTFSNGGMHELETEFSFSLKEVLESGRNYFGFQYWVNSDYHIQKGVQIRYPKDISLLNSRFSSSMQLKFAYDRAPIITPYKVNSIPVVSVFIELYQVEDNPKTFRLHYFKIQNYT